MERALLVQKYGGTSVGDAERIRNVAARIAAAHAEGNKVVAVVSAMGKTTDDLIDLAESIARDPAPRDLDLLLSTGETISCALMAMALREIGVDAAALGGGQAGIRTDDVHGRASIVAVDPKRVRAELDKGRVVIVAGFQGFTEELDVTTLGRGASDLTAVAMAAALGAERCEVYTDVEGIFTADPRVVPDARVLREVSYEEMLELASYGAKMQPRSIELAARYQTPVLVASSMSGAPGTLIHGAAERTGEAMEVRNKVSGVTYERGVARITVRAVPDRPGVAAALFTPLAEAGVSVDTIVQNASAERLTDLSFTVDAPDLARALAVARPIAEKIGAAEVGGSAGLGSVSIVGTGMQNAPGYAARMFRALHEAQVNIEMITTSQIRITCLVGESHVERAVRALHDAFELAREDAAAGG